MPVWAVTSASECLGQKVRTFGELLERTNDPEPRETLARCVATLREQWLEAQEDATSLTEVEKDTADGSAGRRRAKSMREDAEEDVKVLRKDIDALEALTKADAKLLSTRITDLEKAEAAMTLDDESAEQLERTRRAYRKLLPVITVVDGKVTLREDDYTRAVAREKAAEDASKAQEALAAAREQCKTSYAHLEKVTKAAALTECIDALARVLRIGSNTEREYDYNAKLARRADAVSQEAQKASDRAKRAADKAEADAAEAEREAAKSDAEAKAADKEAKDKAEAVDQAYDAAQKVSAQAAAENARRVAEIAKAKADQAAAEADAQERAKKEAEKVAAQAAATVKRVEQKAADLEAERAALRPDLEIFKVDSGYYNSQLARFEEAGRRLVRLRMKELSALHDKRKNASDADKPALDAKIKAAELDLEALKERVIVPGEDPVQEFADFEQWFNKFSLGYEYQSITNAFSKGFPRVGFTAGFHYPRLLLPEESPNFSFWCYGLYNTFTLALTNSAELKTTPLADEFAPPAAASRRRLGLLEEGDPEPDPDPDTPPKVEPKRALELETSFFLPFWRSDYQLLNPRLRTRIGPYVTIGGRKIDDESFVHHRVYGGIRLARSPETFADFLYGKSGGLSSRRLEARGQLAVPHVFKNGGYFVVGAVGNFGVNKRRHGGCEEGEPHCAPIEKDSIRFYITYDIPTSGLFGFFGSN